MSTLAATPDSQRSIVRLDLDFTDTLVQPDAYAIVRTRLDTGAAQQIRQSPVAVPITAVYQQLNSNADMELGIANWTAIAISGAVPTLTPSSGGGHFNRGSAGLQMTTSATANTGPAAESEKCPVTPGQVYAVSAWVATSTAAYLPSVGINWYNASNVLIGTTLGPATVATPGQAKVIQPTTFQPGSTLGYGWVAPPGAVNATVVVGFNSEASFASNLVFYYDEVRLLKLGSLVQGVTTPPVPTSLTDATVPLALGRLTTGQGVAFDHEMPLDTQVSYTATAYVINGTWAITTGGQNIEANSFFEQPTNLTGWGTFGGAAQSTSTVQAHQGVQSLRIAPDGVTANGGSRGEGIPGTPGLWYGFSTWVFMTTGASFVIGLEWDNAAGFLGQTTVTQTPATGTWTKYSGIGQMIPATNSLGTVAKFGATGAAGNFVYIDQAQVWSPTVVPATATSGPVVCPSGGMIWLKDPLAPGNSLQITGPRRIYSGWGNFASAQGIGFLGVPDEIRKAFSAAADVNSQDTPMYQTRRRGARSSSLHLAPHSFADRDALRTLCSAGTPLLLQAPSIYGIPDGYLLLGDETTGLFGQDMRREARSFSLPFQVVAAPVGPAQAPQGYRWQDTGRLTASWGAVMASGGGVYDAYGRVVAAGGLGTPDIAPVASYTLVGTAADFSVAFGGAQVVLPAVATPHVAVLGSYGDLKTLQVTVIPPVNATGSFYQLGLVFRYQDASNYYRYVIEFGTANATTRWIRRVGGVETTLISSGAYSYTAGQLNRIEVHLTGSAAIGWTWPPEIEARSPDSGPDTALFTDSAPGVLANPGAIGWYASRNTGNTNANLTPTFDDLVLVTGPTWQQVADGALA